MTVSRHTIAAEVPVTPYIEAVPVASADVLFNTERAFSVDPAVTHRVTVTAQAGPLSVLVRRFNGAGAQIDSTMHETPAATLVVESAAGPADLRVAPITGPFSDPQVPASVVVETLHERHSLPLNVQSATVTLDDSWSPYVQAAVVCTTPATTVLARMDPREAVRVRLTLVQAFGDGTPLADQGTGDVAALDAAYGGSLAAWSAQWAKPFNQNMRASVRRHLDLSLRRRDLDVAAGTMTLELASDEAALQDAALVSTTSATPGGSSLIAAVGTGLARVGAALTDNAGDVTDLDPDSLAWTPGTSAWDYLAPLVDASGRRLWCDEMRSWHLGLPGQPKRGEVRVTPIQTDQTDTIDRDGDWYDSVVVEYRWTDSGGVDHVRYDSAGPANATRTMFVQWDRPWVRAGAAQALLNRAQGRARSVVVDGVSDYSAEPGKAVNVTLPDGLFVSGSVLAVQWRFPEDVMTVTTRDLLAVPAGSFLAIDPNLTIAGLSPKTIGAL